MIKKTLQFLHQTKNQKSYTDSIIHNDVQLEEIPERR